MLKPLRQSSRVQKALVKSIPAPIGGWNARDPLAAMSPTDAVIMDNWRPRTGDLQSRRGSIDWCTGFPDQVNSLMVYAGASSSEMFAASSDSIYNATSKGVVGSAVVSGLTSSKINYINFSTAGGKFLFAVNGSDLANLYNGSTWSNPSITGIGSLTTADFSNISTWKNRIFLTQKNSLSLWYLPINSISGAASEINFGPLFDKGGKIVQTANWTIDGGYGMDDHFVIVTSEGQVAVYNGTDPSNAATFTLVGVYNIGAPVGDNPCVKYGGELVIITLDGFVPLSSALTSTRTNNRIAVSDKISGAVTVATTDYQYNFGWEAILFPSENLLIFNVPVVTGVTSYQYVMNTITGAWSRFKGWNANSFELMDDELYFATNGKVCKAWQGTSDSGNPIETDLKPAFNYFDAMGQVKQWKMCRPIFTGNFKPIVTMGLNVDFDELNISNTVSFAGSDNYWDVAVWGGNRWSGMIIYKDWQTIFGVGYCAALRMKTSSSTLDLQISSIDYTYEQGGIIG